MSRGILYDMLPRGVFELSHRILRDIFPRGILSRATFSRGTLSRGILSRGILSRGTLCDTLSRGILCDTLSRGILCDTGVRVTPLDAGLKGVNAVLGAGVEVPVSFSAYGAWLTGVELAAGVYRSEVEPWVPLGLQLV